MTLRILPLGNGFALVDTSTRQIFEPWFAYEDATDPAVRDLALAVLDLAGDDLGNDFLEVREG